MKKLIIAIYFISLVTACGNKRKLFEVSGKITNTTAKKVYLQYLVWGADRPIIVDSTSLQKDGSFIVATAYGKEESIYELLIENTASLLLINDNETIFLNVAMNNFKKYTINGSTASADLHSFLNTYSTVYPEFIGLTQRIDTIENDVNKNDSITTVVKLTKELQLQKINTSITTVFKNTNSPALQYYLIAKAFVTMPLQQIQQLNSAAIGQHPSHTGLAFLKSVITKELEKQKQKALVLQRQIDSIKMKSDSLNKKIIDTTKRVSVDSLRK
jgi:hypothetical protein